MPFTQMASALVADEIDAAIITATEYVRVGQRLKVDVLLTGSQLTTLPLDLTSVIVGRDDWMRQNDAAVVRFMRTMLKTRLFMRRDIAETGGATIKQIIKRDLKFDDFLTDTFYNFRAGYSGRELDFINWLQVSRVAVAQHGRMLEASGLLKGKPAPSYDEAVDLRCVRKAFEEAGETWDEAKAAH
jgi:ABC-type nitrate/sulfonate/bicarbonate transport system substrate-binding protein